MALITKRAIDLLRELNDAEGKSKLREYKMQQAWSKLENRLQILDLKVERAKKERENYLEYLTRKYPNWGPGLSESRVQIHRSQLASNFDELNINTGNILELDTAYNVPFNSNQKLTSRLITAKYWNNEQDLTSSSKLQDSIKNLKLISEENQNRMEKISYHCPRKTVENSQPISDHSNSLQTDINWMKSRIRELKSQIEKDEAETKPNERKETNPIQNAFTNNQPQTNPPDIRSHTPKMEIGEYHEFEDISLTSESQNQSKIEIDSQKFGRLSSFGEPSRHHDDVIFEQAETAFKVLKTMELQPAPIIEVVTLTHTKPKLNEKPLEIIPQEPPPYTPMLPKSEPVKLKSQVSFENILESPNPPPKQKRPVFDYNSMRTAFGTAAEDIESESEDSVEARLTGVVAPKVERKPSSYLEDLEPEKPAIKSDNFGVIEAGKEGATISRRMSIPVQASVQETSKPKPIPRQISEPVKGLMYSSNFDDLSEESDDIEININSKDANYDDF